MQNFLKQAGWDDAGLEWRKADWSPRDYARLTKPNGTTAILLRSPPDHSPETIIGHQLGHWLVMNRHYKQLGLNAPDILATDEAQGLVLMEDFGDETIAKKGEAAYLKATEILIQMRDHPKALSSRAQSRDLNSNKLDPSTSGAKTPFAQDDNLLLRYEDSHVYKALRFYPQYILKGDKSLTQEWFKLWREVENSLPPCPQALTHIDYAAQNLMWMDGEIGIIDFQASCKGPFVYDIVNLLEDIRLGIPETIKTSCQSRYCAALSPDDKALFETWYPVITAQFYARILGQIMFLSEQKGRDDLMQYYDSTSKRFDRLLKNNETLKPIKLYITFSGG
jgi:aminoglycoside/choline kinase family phosphotransferase